MTGRRVEAVEKKKPTRICVGRDEFAPAMRAGTERLQTASSFNARSISVAVSVQPRFGNRAITADLNDW